ncbi:hypothetical protein SAMN02910292_01153 [Lachnospiraceae bacterium XBB2008]|nr:hypothetical protein SAMN02910292_01153 [Lachnospiraceae bacterium XBB2008]
MSERFAVYKHKFVTDDSQFIIRQFIVLKKEDGTIQFTNFHKYVKNPKRRVKKVSENGNNRFYFVVKLLNYAYFYAGINTLDELTVEIVESFLNEYGLCELPDDDDFTTRSESTVKMCVNTILDFLETYINDKHEKPSIKEEDLFRKVNKRDKKGKVTQVKVPRFDVVYKGSDHKIYRDMPNKAFNMLLENIILNHKEILGLVILQAFAGLRPSEACNVRRADSPLGSGFLFEITNGEFRNVKIDLLKEQNLRSDYVIVGNIKKERIQAVPQIFLESFQKLYNIYIEYMNDKPFEAAYGPFSVNKQGKAYTYASYRVHFQNIIRDEMIPLYLDSNDPELVTYGQILTEKRLSPHIFRHWYTVQIILSGETNVGTIMSYRGDTSPESSLTYLNNKSELAKMYEHVNAENFDYLKWAAIKKQS